MAAGGRLFLAQHSPPILAQWAVHLLLYFGTEFHPKKKKSELNWKGLTVVNIGSFWKSQTHFQFRGNDFYNWGWRSRAFWSEFGRSGRVNFEGSPKRMTLKFAKKIKASHLLSLCCWVLFLMSRCRIKMATHYFFELWGRRKDNGEDIRPLFKIKPTQYMIFVFSWRYPAPVLALCYGVSHRTCPVS